MTPHVVEFGRINGGL
jgi:hypothetical protein